MTTITFPNTFVADEITDAQKVNENTYFPNAPDVADEVKSLDLLNGWYSSTNMSGKIRTEDIQHGAFSGAGMVGGTANLNYFNTDDFRSVTAKKYPNLTFTPATGGPPYASWIPIPGGATTFFMPYDANYLFFTWNICLANNGKNQITGDEGEGSPYPMGNNYEKTGIQLFVKGPTDSTWKAKGATRRLVPPMGERQRWLSFNRTAALLNPKDGGRQNALTIASEQLKRIRYGVLGNREYTGHWATTKLDSDAKNRPVRGWYQAALRIVSTAHHSRVRVRSMRYMYFK